MNKVADLDEEREARTGEQRRPLRRLDCLPGGVNAARPCPYVSCRYHLADLRTLARKPTPAARFFETLPEPPVEEVLAYPPLAPAPPATCVLDLVEPEPGAGKGVDHQLEEIGNHFACTRQRIEQIERNATAKLGKRREALALKGEIERGRVHAFARGEDDDGGEVSSLRSAIDRASLKAKVKAPPVRMRRVAANGLRVGEVVGGKITKRRKGDLPLAGGTWSQRHAAKHRAQERAMRGAPEVEWFGEDDDEAPARAVVRTHASTVEAALDAAGAAPPAPGSGATSAGESAAGRRDRAQSRRGRDARRRPSPRGGGKAA